MECSVGGYRLLNNRYLKVSELESGSFATVFKAIDCFSNADGTLKPEAGAARLLSAEHADLVSEVGKISPEIEYVRGDPEDFSEAKKNAI